MIRLLSLFLVMSCTAGAYAQASQNSDVEYDRELSAKRAESAMYNYSKCLIRNKKREKLVDDYLLIPDGHPDQDNVNQKLIVPGCAINGSRMSFEGSLFRRSLFTALYVKYYRNTKPTDINVDYEVDYTAETSPKYGTITGAQLVLRKISDCTVRNNPIAVHNFIVAKLHSKSEKLALPNVVTALSNCLPNETELKFSRTILKGQLAEALYKLRASNIQNTQEAAE